MRLLPFKKWIALLLIVCFSELARADVLGVEDAALLANAIKQFNVLKAQLENAKSQLENAKSQLDSLKNLTAYNSGSYGYGSLENGLDNLKNWQYSADSWEEALKNVAGGNPARYAELVKIYEKSHPILSDVRFAKGATTLRLNQFKQNKAVNKAISVQTTYAFNDINNHLKRINTLSSNIDKAPNTKAAMDLNSRLIAEVAYISALNLKLQTLISQQLAENASNEILEEGEWARFNTLPDE